MLVIFTRAVLIMVLVLQGCKRLDHTVSVQPAMRITIATITMNEENFRSLLTAYCLCPTAGLVDNSDSLSGTLCSQPYRGIILQILKISNGTKKVITMAMSWHCSAGQGRLTAFKIERAAVGEVVQMSSGALRASLDAFLRRDSPIQPSCFYRSSLLRSRLPD